MQTMASPFPPPVADALKAAVLTMEWAVEATNGKTIPPSDNEKDQKRRRLSAALWHLCLEHSMAIVLLVQQTMFGSALALIRVASETAVRALWLSRVARDHSVDNAAADKFPPFQNMVDALEAPDVLGPGALAALQGDLWKRLNDYTHSGAQQMLARLTMDGNIADDYAEGEKLAALGGADVLMHLCVIHLLDLAGEARLHGDAVQRLFSERGSQGAVAE